VTAEVSDGTASTTVDSVEANESVTVNIPDEGNVNSVESVSFSVSDSSSNVDVSVTELSEKPDEVEEPSTRTYRYQQIQVTPSEGTVSSAKINFKVSKQEIDDRQVSLADVVMQRYSEGGWQELPTRLSGETDTHYRFVATSEGFSYYAITFADDGTDDQQQNETTGNQTDETREEPETDTELILYLLGLMVLAGLVAVYGFREQIDDFVASLVSEKD
jgi:PGF-pre-PGF domain-containing protein